MAHTELLHYPEAQTPQLKSEKRLLDSGLSTPRRNPRVSRLRKKSMSNMRLHESISDREVESTLYDLLHLDEDGTERIDTGDFLDLTERKNFQLVSNKLRNISKATFEFDTPSVGDSL